jgi:hypothetical protein
MSIFHCNRECSLREPHEDFRSYFVKASVPLKLHRGFKLSRIFEICSTLLVWAIVVGMVLLLEVWEFLVQIFF